MEFSWTTFVLEIINFLVLLWILKRFLYKPVLEAIAQRKAAIEKTLSDANAIQSEAQAFKHKYEGRLEDWEREKEKARTQLRDEIKDERTRLMAELKIALEQERGKNRVLEQRRIDELSRGVEAEAMAQGRRFLAGLLPRFASPELESKIIEIVMNDLPRLSDDKKQAIRAAHQTPGSSVRLSSAFPVRADQRDALMRVIEDLIGQPVRCELTQDPNLIAGVRISIGAWVLRANLQDELEDFSEAGDGSIG
ncbi:MAG TPA: F0F1 ATP synthase subunit delta [Nitrospiria bacterium]|nr:F0F1 ATP synthase subunit delta [Nitrospiria bacterium]